MGVRIATSLGECLVICLPPLTNARGIHARTRPKGLAGPFGEKCFGDRLTRAWPSRGRTKPARANVESRHPTRPPLATKRGQEPGRSANAGPTQLTPPPCCMLTTAPARGCDLGVRTSGYTTPISHGSGGGALQPRSSSNGSSPSLCILLRTSTATTRASTTTTRTTIAQ